MIRYLADVNFYGSRIAFDCGLIINPDVFRSHGSIDDEAYWLPLVSEECAFVTDLASIESEQLAEEEVLCIDQTLYYENGVYKGRIAKNVFLNVREAFYRREQQKFPEYVDNVEYWLDEEFLLENKCDVFFVVV